MATTIRNSTRSTAIDALRGFAILVMILDHIILTMGVGEPLRFTLTRIAMPLFMIIGGTLTTRANPARLALVLAVGAALQAIAPAYGALPLLAGYATGILIVAGIRRWGTDTWTAPALAGLLTITANGWTAIPGSYDLAAVAALVLLGTLIPRHTLTRLGRPLPRWMASLGRYPLTLYVGHILVLVVIAGVSLG